MAWFCLWVCTNTGKGGAIKGDIPTYYCFGIAKGGFWRVNVNQIQFTSYQKSNLVTVSVS